MEIDPAQLRELISAGIAEGVGKAVDLAATRVLPGTVTGLTAGAWTPVLVDGNITSTNCQNPTTVALPIGARVLVLFFPPHGAVILGAGAPTQADLPPPAPRPTWRWSLGPFAHSPVYDFDWAYLGKAVTLTSGRIIFVTADGGTPSINIYGRLDPPYTAWTTMWAAPGPCGEFPEVQAVRQNVAIIGGSQIGAGGQLYHGPLDLGEAQQTGNGGMGAGARDPYGPWDVSYLFAGAAWDTNLGGWYEAVLQYFASAVDLTLGRIWQVGPRANYPTQPGNFTGFLDVPDGDPGSYVTTVPWIRTADLPAGAGGDTNIEGHSACVDQAGNLYVGGGSDPAVIENRFRRYLPGPPIAAGVAEVQRFQETDAPGWTSYQLAFPTTAFNTSVTINEGDNAATIQASFDAWLGAGIVTIAGTDVDFTVTWTATGMQPQLVVVSNGAGNTIVVTVTVHGSGYPSTDTWTALTAIPGAFCYRGVMVSDDSFRVYYTGGIDGGGNRLSTHYRYTPDVGWDTLDPIPANYVTVSIYETTGESQPGLLLGGKLYYLVYAPDDTQTRLAAFDTATETWQLSPPSSQNHQRGGFTYAGGFFWAIAGADPLSNTRTAIVEKIPLP